MKIQILPEANEDLIAGFYFYEKQSTGLGDYFLDSLFSDIDSLLLYSGFIQSFLVRTAAFPGDFRSRFTMSLKANLFAYRRYMTVGKIRPKFDVE